MSSGNLVGLEYYSLLKDNYMPAKEENRREVRNNKTAYPTSPFQILEPLYPWIDEFYVVQERRATDFKAPKLGNGSSGKQQKGKEGGIWLFQFDPDIFSQSFRRAERKWKYENKS